MCRRVNSHRESYSVVVTGRNTQPPRTRAVATHALVSTLFLGRNGSCVIRGLLTFCNTLPVVPKCLCECAEANGRYNFQPTSTTLQSTVGAAGVAAFKRTPKTYLMRWRGIITPCHLPVTEIPNDRPD